MEPGEACLMEQHLASLIGMLLTDGGVSKISKNRFEIFLASNSKGLRNEFELDMREHFGVDRFYTIHGKTVCKIRAVEESAGLQLLRLSPTFRTRPCNVYPFCPKMLGKELKTIPHECNSLNGYPPTKVPNFIMEGPLKTKRTALRSAMSGDGGVEFHEIFVGHKKYLQRRLIFRCHNPNLKIQWKKLFEDCGFNITETKNEIRISGIEQLLKFQAEIGFLNDVKVERSKYWNGFEKNEVLNKMISSFLVGRH